MVSSKSPCRRALRPKSNKSPSRYLNTTGGGLGLWPQVLRHLLEGQDEAVLRVHVQEAHLVADLEAIEAALLDDAYIEAVACRVHHGGPHTAAGRGPRHQHGVNVHLVEVPNEGGPEEATGPTLRDNEILGLRPNILDDRVANMLMFQFRGGQYPLARLFPSAVGPGGSPSRSGRTRRIDDGHAHLSPH